MLRVSILRTSSLYRKHLMLTSLQGHTLLTKIEGADAKSLTAALEQYSKVPIYATAHSDKAPQPPPTTINGPTRVAEKEESEEELNARLTKLMNQSKVVVFMKGDPDSPRCGFSRKTVEALRGQKVEFTSFDILTDESVRQGTTFGAQGYTCNVC